MGRRGISYLDVERAAEELQKKRENPTVDAVRALLGTGSKSTIVPYLKKWKSYQNNKVLFTPKKIDSLPLVLTEKLFTSLKYRFEFLKTDDKLQAEIKLLKEDLDRLFDAYVELIKTDKFLEIERQRLKQEIFLLRKKLHQSEKNSLFLLQEKINLREELKKLKRELIIS